MGFVMMGYKLRLFVPLGDRSLEVLAPAEPDAAEGGASAAVHRNGDVCGQQYGRPDESGDVDERHGERGECGRERQGDGRKSGDSTHHGDAGWHRSHSRCHRPPVSPRLLPRSRVVACLGSVVGQ
jgi:hypothetical protein